MTTTDLSTVSQCAHCGADLEPDARYCANCGQEVATASASSPPAAPTFWRDTEASMPALSTTLVTGGGIGKLFSASGRIGRLEFFLTIVSIWLATIVIWAVTAFFEAPFVLLLLLLAAWVLATIVSVTAGIKRLHDFDQSGWLILLSFVPIVGFVLGLILLFKGPSRGLNQYGYAGSGSPF